MINLLKIKIQNEEITPFFLAVLIFSIPTSPTIKSVSIGLISVLICLIPAYRQRIYFVISEPFSIAAFLLVFIAYLSCFWGISDYHEELAHAEKYSKLLYLPILAAGFTNKKTRVFCIQVFLLASVFVCVISICKKWMIDSSFISAVGKEPPDPGKVFHNHIVTGYMMAFAAYLSGLFAIKNKGIKQIIYLLLGLLLSFQVLFINTGRTGYVIYFILFVLLLMQCFSSKRVFLSLMIYSLIIGIVLIKVPSVLSTGMTEAIQNIRHYKIDNKNTSVGFRLQFHEYAKKLFLDSPYIGQGAAGFAAHYRIENPIPARGRPVHEPHSQYWLIASEFGMVGLLALAYLFISLLIVGSKLIEMKPVLIGLLIPFFFANLTDSFLTNTGIGYLFIFFSALCLGEYVENKLNSRSVLAGSSLWFSSSKKTS